MRAGAVRRTLVACATAALTLAACSSGPPADEPTAPVGVPSPLAPGAATGTASPSPSPTAGEPSLPEVALVEAGAQPREPLRLRLTEGEPVGADLSMAFALEQTIDGESGGPADPIGVVFGLQATTTSVAPDGTAEIAFEYDRAELEDPGPATAEQAAAIEDGLAELVGTTGTQIVTDQGEVITGEIDASGAGPAVQGYLDQAERQLQALSVPFPEEAVGLGARWTVTTILDAGYPVTQVLTYELGERNGERVLLRVEGEQRAEPGPVGEAGAELLEHLVTVTGTIEMDLVRPFPVEASTDAIGRIDVRSSRGGSPTRVVQDLAIETRFAGR